MGKLFRGQTVAMALFSAGLFYGGAAQAFWAGQYGSEQGIDFSRPTSVLVMGKASDQGAQFVYAAASRARKIHEVYPDRQIVFLVNKEENRDVDSHEALIEVGVQDIVNTGVRLNERELRNYLAQFSPGTIETLDFYSHSTPHLGIILESELERADGRSADYESLRDRFSPNAFAMIHGCNGGFRLAPHFSEIWGIPVAGSLASSEFENLHNTGKYYQKNPNFYPAGGWAAQDSVGLRTPKTCGAGKDRCVRMKPGVVGYFGKWAPKDTGFVGGLVSYKFFCRFDDIARCQRTMALSLLVWPSSSVIDSKSSLAAFKAVAQDYLCPNHVLEQAPNARQKCIDKLEASLGDPDNSDFFVSGLLPNSGPTFDCSLKGCKVQVVCKQALGLPLPIPGTCRTVIDDDAAEKADTVNREYRHFLDGFKQINPGAFAPPATTAIAPVAPVVKPSPAAVSVPVVASPVVPAKR